MPLHYFDTSAIAKRYLTEIGSNWVSATIEDENVAVSTLTTVEFASTLARRVREGLLTAHQQDEIFQAFLADRAGYIIVGLSPRILHQAATLSMGVTPSVALRSLDAIHLACARQIFNSTARVGISTGAFVSADRRLLAAAEWAGLPVENPEDHP